MPACTSHRVPSSFPPLRAPTRQRGNALVFSMLSLVIGGIVLALGIGYYQNAQANAQVQGTISEVSAIIGSAQQNYGQYGYNGLTTAVAVGSRVIPDSRADSNGTTATDSYSGAITLVDNSSKTPDTALLSYANVPASQCTQIVNGAQSLARQVGVAGVDVKALDASIDIVKLNTQCTSGANVKIDFIFGRT
jgi:PilS N terminal